MNFIKSPILALSPHTDDVEIGCGGLISHAIDNGAEVYYVVFSNAIKSLPEGFPDDTLKIESRNAALTLGIKKENIFFYDYPVREFDSCRQKILDTMIDLRSKLSPELILTPSVNDVHQDHSVIYNESLRCFKKKSILCYEEPWNNISFSTDFFIGLDEKHINAKINAISCYKSQSNRIYMHPDNIRALALTRGTQLNGGYAETFEVLRWII